MVALTSAFAVGCGKREAPTPPVPQAAPAPLVGAAEPAVKPAEPAVEPAEPEAKPAEPEAQVAGRIRVVYEASKQPRVARLRAKLEGAEAFTGLMTRLDAHLTLPRDLPIRFSDCDEEDQGNAYYDEEAREIRVCWSLVREMARDFARDAREERLDRAEADASLVGATLFTVLHELAHALVHVLDLPITGKEEDVADQLATWLLVSDSDHAGADTAIDGALSFLHDAEAEQQGDEELATWDEHSLSEQRFYNIVCWVYGSNPEGFGDLLESADGPLPDDRAELCPDEWKKLASAWPRLLKDHLRR
ncbi:MAG: hypothetical protein CVU56_25005 [Deltaproteobacteria bacterium HGW-Deltaproteobacteria-14]|nr:MAG: hypothetical protein CVU56_25005 [Deltaproteobacteria bacterium HGW-Deltaproteobacteria-14]